MATYTRLCAEMYPYSYIHQYPRSLLHFLAIQHSNCLQFPPSPCKRLEKPHIATIHTTPQFQFPNPKSTPQVHTHIFHTSPTQSRRHPTITKPPSSQLPIPGPRRALASKYPTISESDNTAVAHLAFHRAQVCYTAVARLISSRSAAEIYTVIDGHSTDLLDGENGDGCMSRVLWRRAWVGIRVWKWENGRLNMVCGYGLNDVRGGKWMGCGLYVNIMAGLQLFVWAIVSNMYIYTTTYLGGKLTMNRGLTQQLFKRRIASHASHASSP